MYSFCINNKQEKQNNLVSKMFLSFEMGLKVHLEEYREFWFLMSFNEYLVICTKFITQKSCSWEEF